ncbi:MAG: Flp pilus assembly protein CpaB [Tepidiformaceae bacterium]
MARTIATSASSSGRNRGVLMLAAVFGILSAALVFAFLNSKGGDGGGLPAADETGGAESVVVVTRDIQAGEKITSDMLTTRSLPASALLTGRLTRTEDVVGKVATAPLFIGEQVVAPKVTTFAGQNTVSFKVPDGLRALALQVPHEAWVVGGLVQPGDHVDILGLMTLIAVDPLTGVERLDTLTGIVAQDVEVLAVSQSLIKVVPNTDAKAGATVVPGATTAPSTAGSKPLDTGETYEKSLSVTVAVTPELAAKLALLDAMKDDQGQYRLIVRQKGDEEKLTGSITWSLEDILTKKR